MKGSICSGCLCAVIGCVSDPITESDTHINSQSIHDSYHQIDHPKIQGDTVPLILTIRDSRYTSAARACGGGYNSRVIISKHVVFLQLFYM
jgi:hypothetical protein